MEVKLDKELEEISRREKLMWHKKSRAKWINEGDHNTKYYYIKTIIRRRRNRIKMLRDSKGRLLENDEGI